MTPATSAAVVRGALIRDASWLIAGNTAYAACQWAVIIVLSRTAGPSSVGHYALGLAVSAPVYMFLGFGLRTIQVTKPDPRATFADYLALRAVTTLAALIAIWGVGLVYDGRAGEVIALVGLAKGFDAMSDIHQGLFQRTGSPRYASIALAMTGITSLSAITLVISTTGDLRLALTASALCSGATWLAYVAPAARRAVTRRPDLGEAATSLAAALRRPFPTTIVRSVWPLGLASGVTALTSNVPQLVLMHLDGERALGAFAAFLYVVVAVSLVCGVVAQVLVPAMSGILAAGGPTQLEAVVHRLLLGALVLGGAIAAAIAVAAPVASPWIYGEAYASHAGVLAVMAVAILGSAPVFVLDPALLSLRRYAEQVQSSLVVLAVTVLTACVTIPALGIVGAAWTLVVSMTARSSVKFVAFRRFVRAQR